MTQLKALVTELTGGLASVRGEKLWFNHLLNELHWDMSKRLEGDGVAIPTVGFRTTLMAVTLLRLTVSALPLEQRVEKAEQMAGKSQHTAARLVQAVVRC